jgi:two-component system chemotaxis response regulator CheB
MALRVLVVDDTVVFRKGIAEVLKTIPEVEVVGTASNGKIAIARVAELKPDLITLDVDMPEMDGLAVLEELRRRRMELGVVMVSALTLKGGRSTIRALELGAFDFIAKPEGGSFEDNNRKVREALLPIVRAFLRKKEIHAILTSGGLSPSKPSSLATSVRPARTLVPARAASVPAPTATSHKTTGYTTAVKKCKPEIVVIGVSTGGPAALAQMLPTLPADLGAPMVIVQHMPAIFTQTLAQSLDVKCALRVQEAEPSELLLVNRIYLAPGGRQTKVEIDSEGRRVFRITDDPPENNCKPSVDYLFRSVALNIPGRCCAVIMTGMGNDGTVGLRLLKRSGSHVIAQDAATSVVFGMPKSAIDAGVVDAVLPLEQIASAIVQSVKCQMP